MVGGGLAGLATARRVVEAGRTAVVLEARPDRVGGRVETREHEGFAFDLGATWIGAGHARAAALVDELGLDTRRTHAEGAAVIVHERVTPRRDTRRRRDRLRELEQRLAERRLDRLARRVPSGSPWAAPRAAALDGQTLEAWLRRSALTRRSRTELRLLLTNVLAAEPEEVSLLHALHYLGGNRGLSAVLNIAGGAQERLVDGGAQALADRMAAGLGDAVLLDTPVRRIVQRGAGVQVESDAASVDAGVAVVTTPPGLTGAIEFDPVLPAGRGELTAALQPGHVIRVAALYEDAFWRGDGLGGDAWGTGLPFSFTHDVSPAAGAPGVMAVFFLGDRARRLRRLDANARRRTTLDALASCFGGRAERPVAYFTRDWNEDPWAGGGYSANAAPGLWTRHGHTLREPAGRVVWAGSETATAYVGYMEGALESAERAAAEALAMIGP